MNRRLSGVLALIGAAIAMVVISGGNRAIPGSANALPVPPAPSIGDCLLERPSALRLGGRATVALEIGPCRPDARFGEISAVLVDTPNAGDVCLAGQGTYGEYSGLTAVIPAKQAWQPQVNVTATILQPDARQRAAGQNWSACLLSPANTLDSYADELKDSFGSPHFPGAFARCLSGTDNFISSAQSCRLPHPAESLGEQVIFDNNVDVADLEPSCREFAAVVTGAADPTAGGQLQIRVSVFQTDQTRMNEEQERMNIAFCTIGSGGDRLLSGTLIGLGSAPIPWAN